MIKVSVSVRRKCDTRGHRVNRLRCLSFGQVTLKLRVVPVLLYSGAKGDSVPLAPETKSGQVRPNRPP